MSGSPSYRRSHIEDHVDYNAKPKRREKYTAKVELWSCKICDNTYTTQGALNGHFTKVHGMKGREKYTAKVELWSCKICDSTYTTQGAMNGHFTKVHGIKKDVKETKKKQLDTATVTSAMNYYRPPPSPRFRCRICRKDLTSQNHLERHVDAYHKDRNSSRPAKPEVKKVSNTTNMNVNVYNYVKYYK